jgi:hypothetical protein
MVAVSYIVGQKLYPVDYEVKRIASYILLALTLFAVARLLEGNNRILNIVIDTALLFVFFAAIQKKERFFTLLFNIRHENKDSK